MELLGIAQSIPVALVASMLYCFCLDRVVLKFERTRRWTCRLAKVAHVSKGTKRGDPHS
jgi:hypothetical protein